MPSGGAKPLQVKRVQPFAGQFAPDLFGRFSLDLLILESRELLMCGIDPQVVEITVYIFRNEHGILLLNMKSDSDHSGFGALDCAVCSFIQATPCLYTVYGWGSVGKPRFTAQMDFSYWAVW